MPVQFDSLLIKTDVTAIKVTEHFILAASGSYLYVFTRHGYNYKNKVKLFDGQSCYGIDTNSASNELLCYGTNKIKIVKCDLESGEVSESRDCLGNDWILTATWTASQDIAALSMHNVIIFYNHVFEEVSRYICEERCILYSGFVCADLSGRCIVLSGTVFSEILIWEPTGSCDKPCSVLQRLRGHKGVIFSIHCIPSFGLICSASDDRTAILWKLTNILNDNELNQEQTNLLCTVNGHTSRIFRCKILNNCLFATGGEDSLVNIWNFQGNLVKTITANKGDSVWSLDYDENDGILVIGSGDGCVTAFALNNELNARSFDFVGKEKFKRLVILNSGNLISLSEEGSLYYFFTSDHKLKLITNHPTLQSYGLLEVSHCRKSFALASAHGDIYIYKEKEQSVALKCCYQTTAKDRIFSLHWLTCKMFLTCEREGDLKLWYLKNNSVQFVARFVLPHSKERWSTAACLTNKKNIIVGDRKGNIHVFCLDGLQALQTLKKAHSHLGITYLATNGDSVYSLGRNGVLKVHVVEASEKQLLPKSSDKLPFNWLSKLEKYDGKHLLLGFSGKNFLIWDCEDRRCILQYSCGGGHRSWDLYKINDTVIFAYLKEQFVNIVCTSWLTLCPVNVVQGLHSLVINSVSIIPIHSKKQIYVVVSGGEDTTFQLSTLHFLNTNVSELFNTRETFKAHLSSIRTITYCFIHESSGESNYLVFSGGGRAQIVLWLLTVQMQGDEIKSINCYEKYSYYENISSEESEMRIMDMTSIKRGNIVILFAACSDGKIKLFTTDIENMNLTSAQVLMDKHKCILKICIFVVCDVTLLATMNTEGKIIFWNIEQLISSDMIIKDSLQPFFSITAHQSGINSYCYNIANNTCFFLTGGDDNATVLHILDFAVHETNLNVVVRTKYVDATSHCAQITGTFITNDYFATTSMDQKVLIYRWSYSSTGISVKLLDRYNSAITDIQGMQFMRNSCSNKILYVILYGKGIEVVKILL